MNLDLHVKPIQMTFFVECQHVIMLQETSTKCGIKSRDCVTRFWDTSGVAAFHRDACGWQQQQQQLLKESAGKRRRIWMREAKPWKGKQNVELLAHF